MTAEWKYGVLCSYANGALYMDSCAASLDKALTEAYDHWSLHHDDSIVAIIRVDGRGNVQHVKNAVEVSDYIKARQDAIDSDSNGECSMIDVFADRAWISHMQLPTRGRV